MKTGTILLLAGIFQFSFLTGASADVLDNWTTNQISTNSFGIRHIVYGNGLYVAVGEKSDYGGFYTSNDGLNWKLQYTDFNAWRATLDYSAGHFSAAASGFGVADVSTNGTNWASSFFPSGSYVRTVNAITYGPRSYWVFPNPPSPPFLMVGSTYVAVGGTDGVGSILTSSNGSSWTPASFYPSVGGPIVSVVYSPDFDVFIALGNNDGNEYVYYNDDGFWYRSNIPGGNTISYGNGLFIVPLNNKTNLISTDGDSWISRPTGLTNMLGKVNYDHGIFVAGAGGYLATSTDGTNWFQYPGRLPGNGLATDGTRLVTVAAVSTNNGLPNSYNGFIYTSDILVGARIINSAPPQIALSGLIGRNYQIQSIDTLDTGDTWRTNTALKLTNMIYTWTDSSATNSAQFYRGALLP